MSTLELRKALVETICTASGMTPEAVFEEANRYSDEQSGLDPDNWRAHLPIGLWRLWPDMTLDQRLVAMSVAACTASTWDWSKFKRKAV